MSAADDERAIVAVLVRYATAIDTRGWALLATCWTEDAEADYGRFGELRGAEEIAAFMERAHRDVGPTLHRMTNFVVTLDGDAATARSYVDALLMPASEGDTPNRGIGIYHDALVRTVEGWRIRRRRFEAVRIL